MVKNYKILYYKHFLFCYNFKLHLAAIAANIVVPKYVLTMLETERISL